MGADEDAAGEAHLVEPALGVAQRQLEMLRRDAVGERQRLFGRAGGHEIAEVPQRGFGDRAPRQGRELSLELLTERPEEGLVAANDAGDGAFVVLGLGQHVGGEMAHVRLAVGDDQHFARPGDHVDVDDAEELLLRRRYVDVAGADDLVDLRDRLGAVGERGHGLRPPDGVDRVDTAKLGGGEDCRCDPLGAHRSDRHDLLDTGDSSGNRVHQQRRRVECFTPGDVDPDARERAVPLAEARTGAELDLPIAGALPFVEGLDPAVRDLQRVAELGAQRVERSSPALPRDRNVRRGRAKAVEALGVVEEGPVAVAANL